MNGAPAGNGGGLGRRVVESVVIALAIAAALVLASLNARTTTLEVSLEERSRQYLTERGDVVRRLDRIEEKIDRISSRGRN